jgi:hypothetical protein
VSVAISAPFAEIDACVYPAIYFEERLRDRFNFEQMSAGSDDAHPLATLYFSACAKQSRPPQLAAYQHRAFRLKGRFNYSLRAQQIKLAHARFLMPGHPDNDDEERKPKPANQRGGQNNLPGNHTHIFFTSEAISSELRGSAF